jgi:hypothetical protein
VTNQATIDPPLAAPDPGSRRRIRLIVAAVVVIALVGGLVVAGRWWTHPTLFHDHGDGFRADPLPVSEAALHMEVIPPPTKADDPEAVVTIRGAEAHFERNSAEATVAFAVCRFRGVPLGYGGGSLGKWCTEVIPLAGDTTFHYERDSHEMLVMTLTPSRPGSARVDEVTIDYALDRSHLWRRGEQTIAVDVTVRAK